MRKLFSAFFLGQEVGLGNPREGLSVDLLSVPLCIWRFSQPGCSRVIMSLLLCPQVAEGLSDLGAKEGRVGSESLRQVQDRE